MAKENGHEGKPWFVFVGIKFPRTLVKAVDDYIENDTHATRSEFIRAAVREKIQRDMPKMWMDIMEPVKHEEALVKEEEATQA